MAPISGVSFGNEHLRGKKTVDIIWSLTYQDGPAAPYLICCSFFPTSLSLSSVFLFLPSFYFFFISCLFSSTSFLLFSFFLFFFSSFFPILYLSCSLGFPVQVHVCRGHPVYSSPKFHRHSMSWLAEFSCVHLVRPHSSLCVPLFHRPAACFFFLFFLFPPSLLFSSVCFFIVSYSADRR